LRGDDDDKTLTYVTKITGISIGAAGAAKGTVDMLEACSLPRWGLCSSKWQLVFVPMAWLINDSLFYF